ncbi:hypothetical protein CHLNCDRAFT_139904 [Chlorella variabilis]|uniref:Tyrosine-protein kinase ephrin type A/B receptor-like domain-containing protein n=1 Tax=Chlorella variabilis TaxID=554065 RepID=E1ZR61_CHLVA|nr:hypothetical protein CHLNCDRAFT_139904 [Chlorella variabilis]EFN51674.1 hypothetical protein CHLNCDRAFT_139904 [Chlorella variabilis]|eukprot:XP_005843776.1 hypothetical protein CHLNCDRAFT_139904 [Chlorella variabilis]
MQRHLRSHLVAAVALLAVMAPPGAVAPLPPKPTFLLPASFSPHPMNCTSGSPLWVSYEWWWQDDEGTGRVQPLGHSIQSGCYPYNQVLPRTGTFQVVSVQHKNPSVFRDQQIRLRKPDGNLIKNMVPLPACKDIHLPDNGAVGCGYNYYRPGLTPQLCQMGNGTVVKLHTLTRNDTAATRLDCRWDDGVAYNTSTAPVSGNVLLQVLNNYIAYPNVVQQYNATDPEYISDKALNGKTIQLTGMLPVALEDVAAYPCTSTGAGCGWSDSSLHTITAQTWTGDTLKASSAACRPVSIGPIFLIPVGGMWRMRLTASSPDAALNPRHLITFDDDFRQASAAGSSGRVLRNESGFVADQQLALDLLQANLSAGWHKMTTARTAATFLPAHTPALAAASLSTYLEVAPSCPPTPEVPFATHVASDASGSLDLRTGAWSESPGGPSTCSLPNSLPTRKLAYLTLSFDLSFLSASASVANASLFLYLSSPLAPTLALPNATLEVYDGTLPLNASLCAASCPEGTTNGVDCFKCPPGVDNLTAVPCAKPACPGSQVGGGSFQGSSSQTYVELGLDAAHVGAFVGGARGLMLLTVVLPQQRSPSSIVDGGSFRTALSPSPPFLLLRASCSGSPT